MNETIIIDFFLIFLRVLKPPGGNSSDIFGGETMMDAPRATKNHMRSNIFSEPEPMAKNSELKIFKMSYYS